MIEKLPSGEFTEKEQNIISRFLENSPEDAVAMEALRAWIDGERQRAEAEGRTSVRDSLEGEVRRAELYLAAGLHEPARSDLEDSIWQAENQMAAPGNSEDLSGVIAKLKLLLGTAITAGLLAIKESVPDQESSEK